MVTSFLDITAADLTRFVEHGDAALASSVTALFSRSILSRSKIDLYLSDPGPTRRLLGLVRAIMELAYSTDPEAALRLQAYLREILEAVLAADPRMHGTLGRDVRGSLQSAAAFATLQTGAFDDCLASTSNPFGPDTGRAPGKPAGWLVDTRYEALIRTFRIEEAVALRALRPPDDGDVASRIVELDDMLDGLVPVDSEALVLKPRPNFSWFVETRDRLAKWAALQRVVVAALRQSFVDLRLPEREWSDIEARFEEAERACASVVAVAEDEGMASEDRRDAIQRGLRTHSEAIYWIQSPPTSRAHTLHDNRHILNYAAMVIDLKSPTAEESELALDQAESARVWSDGVGDHYGAVLAWWAIGCLRQRAGAKRQALEAFSQVHTRLLGLRLRLGSSSARSLLAGTFRTLVPRMVPLALDLQAHDLAFSILEFRRGLALAEATPPPVRLRPIVADASYFAVSVFDDCGVFASLATPDGLRTVARIAVEPADVDRLVARSCPDTWRQGLMRLDQSPRRTLSTIVAPLERAKREGRLTKGSHICLALDHPLSLVPIHYLEVEGMMAVETFSFSRLGSFSEFERLAAAGGAFPRTATSIFVVTRDEGDVASHEMSFERSVGHLRANVDDVQALVGIAADRVRVTEALVTRDIVHVHAHGVFPDVYPDVVVDPVVQAGILVAAAGTLPERSDPGPHTLLVGHILAACRTGVDALSASGARSGLRRFTA